jgi:hypothetical protein
LLQIDKWLSSQLGYNAYNLNSANLKKFNFSKYKSRNILISIKSAKKIQNSFLRKNKLKLIEINLTFSKSLKKNKLINSDFENIRFANNLDKNLILDIAERSFINSRFFRDKKIKKKLAKN